MLFRKIAETVMNEHDSIVYVAGVDDHQMQYMNASAKKIIGLPENDESYLEKKCYELFFKRTTPCEFCKNAILNKEDFCRWDSHSKQVNEHFYHRSKLISLDDKEYHLEITDIITDLMKKQLEMEHQLETQQTLIKCINTLSYGFDANSAINSLLEIVGQYYASDRTYLFEINWNTDTLSNTYEWVNTGITREIDNLQDVPISVIQHWLDIFHEKGNFYISNVDENVARNTREYELLQMQNIQSLIAAPLMNNNSIVGFIGVDNPRKNFEDFELLTSINHVVQNDLERRKATEKLEKLSYEDSLTGLYNRNKFNRIVEELKATPPSKLGIIYIDLNGLKATNDTKGHEEGDLLLKKVATIIRSLSRNDNYRIGGDEFVIILPNIPKQVFFDRIEQLKQRFVEDEVFVAIGSSWRGEDVDIIEQIQLADIDMYANKEKFYKNQ